MKIAISAESTVDLSEELRKKYDIHIVSYTILLGRKSILDQDLKVQKIFDYVAETGILPKTSAVNPHQFKEHFTNLRKNYDAVIHFTLSSEMSASFCNANLAAEKLDNVYVIDSQSLSTGIALLAIYARELANEGALPEEIVEKVRKRVPAVQASFVISRLDYLHKGGRCSLLQLLGADLLRMRPQIVVEHGQMRSNKKFRGKMSNVIHTYVETTLKDFPHPDKKYVFITYTTVIKSTLEKVITRLEKEGFENILPTHAGATITSHCGEGTLGILYINDGGSKKQEK